MKRYDTDEDMRAALDVFLFDTLTDPTLEFVGNVPQEAAYASLEGEAQDEAPVILDVPGMGSVAVSRVAIAQNDSISTLRVIGAVLLTGLSSLTPAERTHRIALANAATGRIVQIDAERNA